jgi:hypothetical protein
MSGKESSTTRKMREKPFSRPDSMYTPLRPSFQLTPSPAAQILLIFGFVHLRVAAGRLLLLESVSLPAAHRVDVRRLLIHVLELSVGGELWVLAGPVDVHYVRHAALGDRRRMSTAGESMSQAPPPSLQLT